MLANFLGMTGSEECRTVVSVILAVPCILGALDHEVQEPGVILLADDEGVRISRFSGAKRYEFVGEAVENRMVLNFDVDLHPFGPLLEVLDGVDALLHLAGGALCDGSPTAHAADARLTSGFHRREQPHEAGRMSGNDDTTAAPA